MLKLTLLRTCPAQRTLWPCNCRKCCTLQGDFQLRLSKPTTHTSNISFTSTKDVSICLQLPLGPHLASGSILSRWSGNVGGQRGAPTAQQAQSEAHGFRQMAPLHLQVQFNELLDGPVSQPHIYRSLLRNGRSWSDPGASDFY